MKVIEKKYIKFSPTVVVYLPAPQSITLHTLFIRKRGGGGIGELRNDKLMDIEKLNIYIHTVINHKALTFEEHSITILNL